MTNRKLELGDVVVWRTHGGRDRQYLHVVGFTPRGKVRLRRGWTTTELHAWWSHESHLPTNYELERPA